MSSKTKGFRKILESPTTEYILESHSGLSAKIAEETGFKGIWASGLSISASLGVRDNNEVSWTQVLDVLEFMSDSTSIPILLDGDTGFGNYNNARRLVIKLEQRDIAAVCIEDKIFPKTNSFIGGEKQPLAGIEEFSGKIRAMKDSQIDSRFSVVARLESFITGWGLDSALERATRYYEAGADAILVHSKIDSFKEIQSFVDVWDEKCPLIIVPTTYYKTPTSDFVKSKISIVVWANYMIRSSISAMQNTAKTIYEDESLLNVEDRVVTVNEIFRLQNSNELKEADSKYLPVNEEVSAIVLAASRGPEFGDLTKTIPKAMIEFQGKPILQHIKETLLGSGIKDITVVGGFNSSAIDLQNIKIVENDKWEVTGNAYSLYKAKESINGTVIISYGDLVYENSILNSLIETPGDIVILADTSDNYRNRDFNYFVKGSIDPSDDYGSADWCRLDEIKLGSREDSTAQWIGLMKLSPKGSEIIKNNFNTFFKEATKSGMLGEFLNYLINQDLEIRVRYSRGKWLDLDNEEDLASFSKREFNL